MKSVFTILSLFLSVVVNAQNISVIDFRLDEMDLTANQQGTTVMDQNGEKCALIKVKTTQIGFSFDAGSLGVSKTLQKTAEIWVYVPHGVRKLSISHQKFGSLDYALPMTTQKARTYIMELKVSIPKLSDIQILNIKVIPVNAMLILDDEMVECTDGKASITIEVGTHRYCVVAPGYYQQEGTIDVTRDNEARIFVELDRNPNSKVKVKQEDESGTYTDSDEKPRSNEFEAIFCDLSGLYGIKWGETTLGEVMSFNGGKKKKNILGIERNVLNDGATILGNSDTDRYYIVQIPTSAVSKKHNFPFSGLSWNSDMEAWKTFLISRGIKIDALNEYGFSTILYYTDKYKYKLEFHAKTSIFKQEISLIVVPLDSENLKVQ